MSGLVLVAGGLLAFALIWDLVLAFVRPYKVHKFCRGKGLDPYCDYTGKVLRFGARWVRPELKGRK